MMRYEINILCKTLYAYVISLESESQYSGENDERDGAGDGMELPEERGNDDLGDDCVGVRFG